MFEDSPKSTEANQGAADVIRDVQLQLQVVRAQSERTESRLIELRERLADDSHAELERAMNEEPSIKRTARAIGTETLDALHRELSDIVVEAPEVVPDDELVDQLDDTAARLMDQHEQLMRAVDLLSESLDGESFSGDEVREAVDTGITRTSRITAAAKRLQRLIDEIAPGVSGRPDDEYVVTGTIQFGEETSDGVTVRAFDRDLREKRLLGEGITDAQGQYEIRYDPTEIVGTEADAINLMIRILIGGETVGESEVHFDASPQERIDLGAPASARPTEYERLRGAVSAVTGDISFSSLSDEEVAFVIQRIESREAINLSPNRVRTFFEATKRAETTPFWIADLYALKRSGMAIDEEALAKTDASSLLEQLEGAVDERIVPTNTINGAVGRFKRAHSRAAGDSEEEAGTTLRVVDEQGEGLPGYTVEVSRDLSKANTGISEDPRDSTDSGDSNTRDEAENADDPTDARVSNGKIPADEIGLPVDVSPLESLDDGFKAITGDDGKVILTEQPVGAIVSSETVTVRNPQGDTVTTTAVSSQRGQITIEVATTSPGVSGDIPVPKLDAELGLSEDVASALAEIKLMDIRAAGDVNNLAVDTEIDTEVATLLNALANLTLVTDPGSARTLHNAGYSHIADVAASSKTAFAEAVADSLSPEETDRVHERAVAGVRMLDGILTERRTRWANARIQGDE